MVGSSKILTVSYGTFSCTLEGFDDSFSTMKAIAEYFRDLAADDRYFGAEPATPDAEMLARIAEREISRRVEARTDGSEIVLRAGNAIAAPTTEGQADAQPEQQAAPAPAQDAPQQNTPLVEEETAVEAVADPEAQEPGSEGEDMSSVLLAPSEPEAAQTDASPLTASVATPTMPPTQTPPSVPRPRTVGATDTPAQAASAIRPAVALSGHPDAESVAAKLQRIRAVVGRGVATLPPIEEDNVPQEEEATAFASEELIDDVTDQNQQHDVLADAKLFDAVETAAAAITADDTIAEQDAAPETDTTDADTSDVAATEDGSAKMSEADIRSDIEGGAEEDADVAAETATEDDVDPELAPAFDVPAPVRVRVIRMRRDTNDAVATGSDDAESTDNAKDETGVISAPEAEGPETEDAATAARNAAAKSLSETVRASIFGEISGTDAAVEETTETEDTAADNLGMDSHAEEEDFADAAERNAFDEDALSDEVLSEQEPSDEDLSDLARLDGADEDNSGETAFTLPASDLSPEAEAELLAELAAVEDEIDFEVEIEVEEELKIEDDFEDDDSWPADISKSADVAAEGVAEAEVEANDDSLAGFDELDDAQRDLGTKAADDGDEDEDEATAQAEDSYETEAEAEEESPALASRRSLIQHADEAAMSRINAQVDVQLNEPEANRRRQAIAQLKAAVAATEAARQMGETREKSPEVENAFRNDLQQVVRPRRPIPAAEARTERPRVAPLKLVAAQRIDTPATAAQPHGSIHPVRPRRVSVQPEATQPVAQEAARTSGSFAAFAKDMGAHGLADLLEAAAAYTAFVEGSEDFSRPQLMNKVRAMSEDDFSREEGLRSFGTLLREGRIMKTRNGRFQVSDETRFKPERRAG